MTEEDHAHEIAMARLEAELLVVNALNRAYARLEYQRAMWTDEPAISPGQLELLRDVG